MKLSNCIEIAIACGLTTLGEAYDNINFHALSLFLYDEIDKEMYELQMEICKEYNLTEISKNIDSILL